MSKTRTFIVNSVIRRAVKNKLASLKFEEKNLKRIRKKTEKLGKMSSLSRIIDITETDCDGVRTELFQKNKENPSDRVILYFHGGAYIAGSPQSHQDMTARLVLKTDIDILSVDYRLAPEHTYPSQLNEAITAYRWLLARGYQAEKTAIGGDSAGGNLALATFHNIKKNKLPFPGAGFFLSPVTDLLATGESIKTNLRKDPMIPGNRISDLAEAYAPGEDYTDPLLSPLYGDFSDFPPMYFTAGSTEVLRDDTLRVVEKLKKEGVDVTCVIRKNMPHVYPSLAAILPEGRKALREISEFLKIHLPV